MLHHLYSLGRASLLLAGLLASFSAYAQAPAWDGVLPGITATSSVSNYASQVLGVVTDAQGNVYVAGSFQTTLTLGSFTLTAASAYPDGFVAKYVPTTRTWAWAHRFGGSGNDYAYGVAVRGSSVYVAGSIINNNRDANAVTASSGSGAPTSLNGATGTTSNDVLLAKYVDQGGSATLSWVQVGGGTGEDIGRGVAAPPGGSSVYLTGYFVNDLANSKAVVLGGNGTTAGTFPQYGASLVADYDALLAKYTDNGATATFGWSQVAGGSGVDACYGVAVSGSAIYVVGQLDNNVYNDQSVRFGGSGFTAGTTLQHGASTSSSKDVVLAKYTDNGSSGSFVWSQVGGGRNDDAGVALAVRGSSLYVTGYLTAPRLSGEQAIFGGSGTTAGTYQQLGVSGLYAADLLLAKYTDQGSSGSFVWSQVGGGNTFDYGTGVTAPPGSSSVYVTGSLNNSASNGSGALFGGSGTTTGTAIVTGATNTVSDDVLLAKYQDNGPDATFAWGRTGGSTSSDYGYGVAVSGQQVYVVGHAKPGSTFGPDTTPTTSPYNIGIAVAARLTDLTLPLPTRAAAPDATLALYPNPAGGATTLTGAAPGAPVQVLDALGRVAATATADATGIARLANLVPGLYLVRAGAATTRLAVE